MELVFQLSPQTSYQMPSFPLLFSLVCIYLLLVQYYILANFLDDINVSGVVCLFVCFFPQGHHMKLFMTYAVQHTLGSRVLIKIAGQEKFRAWLEKTEVNKNSLHTLC